MPRHATLSCIALEPDDPVREGWYIAEYDGRRIVVEVSRDTWGMRVRGQGRDWFLGQPNLPVRLIARADLDRLDIKPPEIDYIRAQIGMVKGLLEGRTEEEDPVGFPQWQERLKDLEFELARLEGRV